MLMLNGAIKLSGLTAEEPDVYFAPEQLLADDKPRSHSALLSQEPSIASWELLQSQEPCDVWAVAVTLVRAWYSNAPFETLSVDELRSQYRAGWNPVETFLHASDMHHAVKALLLKCVALVPGHRIKATELCHEMRRIATSFGPSSMVDTIAAIERSAMVCGHVHVVQAHKL